MLRAAKSRWITWKFIYVYVRFKTSLAAQPYVKFVNFYGEYEQKRGRGAGELYSLFIFSLQLSTELDLARMHEARLWDPGFKIRDRDLRVFFFKSEPETLYF